MFVWVLGIELTFLCLDVKYFTAELSSHPQGERLKQVFVSLSSEQAILLCGLFWFESGSHFVTSQASDV